MESRARNAEGKITWIIVALAVFGLVYVGYQALFVDFKDSIPVSVGSKTFYAQVAANDLERKQGLSGTAELAENEGLIMIFNKESDWRIWMKDMNYPIDIVWIDKHKRVVHTVKSAHPNSYPERYYTTPVDAKYVLELPEGSVRKYNIHVGKGANFDFQGVF